MQNIVEKVSCMKTFFNVVRRKFKEFLILLISFIHTIPVGLGLLCALLDWEHIFNSIGSGKHSTWVIKISRWNILFFPSKIILIALKMMFLSLL
jgi:hypothetical protein